jgi:hypothetical protein
MPSPTTSQPTITPPTMSDNQFIPHDIYGYVPNTLNTGDQLFRIIITNVVTFATNFTGSLAVCAVLPTADVVLSINVNDWQVGSLSFSPTSFAGVFTGPSLTLGYGDIMSLVVNNNDPTMSGLVYTFAGTIV